MIMILTLTAKKAKKENCYDEKGIVSHFAYHSKAKRRRYSKDTCLFQEGNGIFYEETKKGELILWIYF